MNFNAQLSLALFINGGLAQCLAWRYPEYEHGPVVIDPVPTGAEECAHGPVNLPFRIFTCLELSALRQRVAANGADQKCQRKQYPPAVRM